MKLFIIFAACLALSLQDLIPVPGVNINDFQGEWYLVWQFRAFQNYHGDVYCPDECSTWDIDVLNSSTLQKYTSYYPEWAEFVTGPTPSSWSLEDGTPQYVWVGFDTINGQWGTITDVFGSFAGVLSRDPSANSVDLQAQINLLKSQGIPVTDKHSCIILNNDCTN